MAIEGCRGIFSMAQPWNKKAHQTGVLLFYLHQPIVTLTAYYFLLLYNKFKKLGKPNKSIGKPATKPPIIATANGCCICAPKPKPKANGNKAKIAPMAVIKLGRIRKAIRLPVMPIAEIRKWAGVAVRQKYQLLFDML